MIDYARHQFKLVKPTKNGTVRSHLEQIQKQTGRKLKELEGPEFPFLLSHVWSAFLALNDSRSMGQVSANPISYQDIKAFMEVSLTTLSPRDVETIKKLDKVFMEVMNKDG